MAPARESGGLGAARPGPSATWRPRSRRGPQASRRGREGIALHCGVSLKCTRDPLFGTIPGFQSVIQKEWVMAGGEVLDRCNHLERWRRSLRGLAVPGRHVAARTVPRRRGVLGDLLAGLGHSTRIPCSAPSGSAPASAGEAQHGICYRRKYAAGRRPGFKFPLGLRLPSSVHSGGLHPLPQPRSWGRARCTPR